jgi:hypothetical protein
MRVNPYEPSPDEPPYWIESIDPLELEKPPSQQLGVYAEQRRQARGAFDICILFAVVGALQAIAGIVSVFWVGVSPVSTGGAIFGGGVFGALSNWAFKLSDNANTRLERIASDEKTRELIKSISDPKKRDEETSRFLKALGVRSK